MDTNQTSLILEVAETLTSTNTTFSAEDLVVKTWEKNKDLFGLKGHEQSYPDSNKVLSRLMGVKGLVGKGLLEKVGPKLYKSRKIKEQPEQKLEESKPAPKPVLSKSEQQYLKGWLYSSAYHHWKYNHKEVITYSDAKEFWAVAGCENPSSAIIGEVDGTKKSLERISNYVKHTDAVLSDGRSIGSSDLIDLCRMHEYLVSRFSRYAEQERRKHGGRHNK